MRLALIILSFICVLAPSSAAAAPARADRLAAIAWLVGDWTGTGEGQPGRSTSTRRSERMHEGRFIRVEARSEYAPQQGNSNGEIHTSTDIWSFDRRRNLLVMRQFDSLGFASTYVQDLSASTDGRIVLLSETLENVPSGWRARYTYEPAGPNAYWELFELDSGSGYARYVSSSFVRIS